MIDVWFYIQGYFDFSSLIQGSFSTYNFVVLFKYFFFKWIIDL